jgi:hypothetical protein
MISDLIKIFKKDFEWTESDIYYILDYIIQLYTINYYGIYSTNKMYT